ncbi:hypothetical protein [Flavobacterium caeni]|uniref:Lipoprotein n=1 Tax=Flavobacterium caeni TaxID=490189 RepID=A0A1G5EDG3_9FLAO|nr:hypothetical protein [Flavobacterium caeni]SCY25006.1 hypothetical protein SAMN02927903_01022 [Flavobacterium caeni]
MKKIIVLCLLIAYGCGANKTASQIALAGKCPGKGECTIELLRDKAMVVEHTANGIRYSTETKKGTSVVKYQYNRIVPKNVQDGSYRVEIVFEYDGQTNQTLRDGQLEATKMLYGRFCYCKDGVGYFAVNQGTLSIDANGHGTADISVPQISQLIKKIEFDLK